MSDEATKEQPEGVTPDAPEPGVTPEPTEGVKPEQPETPGVTQADLDKVKAALDKEREQTKNLRSQIKGLVDPDEAQQQVKSVEEQLTAVTAERDTLQAEVTRLRVAVETGLPMDLAKRLVGTTEDELRADAEVLAGFKTPAVGTPHARTGAGENGSSPEPFDAKAVAEQARSQRVF